ncbi:Photosystem I reaction center subunit III [filamentous cyanobacterium LEGE 11480]|uniref:Photosystem I reaction center subunit III n=1 Tax=Romeriopsis navalis LEGE 11480 TaxID=2777977 RepID=A0A928VT99_9CYAN|nr:Photosystem I reaction center subunit III [Romeriopsis navalis]MBE9032636.1 Photosystem I reaction center subunit III [Romeriopsis navalis LEGE 11480]
MRRLLALVFSVMLWFGFVSADPAHALYDNLKPCKDVPAFMNRASTSQGGDVANRIDFYANKANLLCGEEGLPHLIIDNPAHAGEFIIPGVMFLYIAGWIGWVGRAYLQAIKKSGKAEEQEIIINVPLAVGCMLTGFAWPLAAFGEFSSGKMLANDEDVTVSPR